MSGIDQRYENTIEQLHTLAKSADLRETERVALQHELDEIRTMLEKLEHGKVEITVFGEVNSGKSSLLNALLGKEVFDTSARAGMTVVRGKHDWVPQHRAFQGDTGAKLVVVDTPGINEVAGAERATIAKETVRYSDIVLFVTFGDLNEVEFGALQALRSLSKPIVLVINKVDLMGKRELSETLESIKRKVAGMIGDDDIVLAAGSPGMRSRIRVSPDGSDSEEEYTPKPIIEDVQARILDILVRERKAIVALNANLFAAEVSGRVAELKVKARAAEADAWVRKCMYIKAATVAINPIPVADIAGGIAVDVVMLRTLAAIYGRPFSMANARELLWTIGRAWGSNAAVEAVTHGMVSALKGITFGLSTILTALPQATVAAWSTFVIGKAANVYFINGGWAKKEPKAIIEDILKHTDQSSILAPLKDHVRGLLRSGGKSTGVVVATVE